ncbi:topoisomerase DNA-binding C4 zinc finger domain-containing protein [Lysobacter capsici]|uniref:topoisomerase DNA-binding C4 zinc finger domain-containing protein n=1 Tax=Lysobacter capsici TaxID=435897 RepID=UPI0009E91A9F
MGRDYRCRRRTRQRTKCPQCEIGVLIVKNGRHGPFVGCSNYSDCRSNHDRDKGTA